MDSAIRDGKRACRLAGLLAGLLMAGMAHGVVPVAVGTEEAGAGLDRMGAVASAARRDFDHGLEAYEANEWALAERLWLWSARAGNVQARYHLGVLYDRLAPGSVAALIWYRRAARAGHSDAQHNLALAYMRGEGVPVDMQRALYWWIRAARQGNVDSQYNLGLVYALGQGGVTPDRERARFWWLQAARRGDPAAQYNLATLYASEPARPDYCRARRWFLASSRNGFSRAAEALALLPALSSVCH